MFAKFFKKYFADSRREKDSPEAPDQPLLEHTSTLLLDHGRHYASNPDSHPPHHLTESESVSCLSMAPPAKTQLDGPLAERAEA